MEFPTKLEGKARAARFGQAYNKWEEYRKAYKDTKDPMYLELQQAFFHIRKGRTVIEIGQAIRAGGIVSGSDWLPRLAVAYHTERVVFGNFTRQGCLIFKSDHSSNDTSFDKKRRTYIDIGKFANPKRNHEGIFSHWWSKAPVPMVPPHVKPKVMGMRHYILWEVEEWSTEDFVPSVDPALLWRINKNFFVVEATWDLTDVERAAMEVRLRT